MPKSQARDFHLSELDTSQSRPSPTGTAFQHRRLSSQRSNKVTVPRFSKFHASSVLIQEISAIERAEIRLSKS